MVRLLQAGYLAISVVATVALRFFVAVRAWVLRRAFPSRRPRVHKLRSHEADPITRLANEAVGKVFLRDFKWSFRSLPDANIGIDARAEILDSGWSTGKLLPLQIRAASSCTRDGDDYICQGEKKHLGYWMKHSLPVFVIVVDLQTGLMLWQRIDEELCAETVAGWSVAVPPTNMLDASARLCFEDAIASDPESQMRSVLALDRTLMEEMQGQTSFFVWDEWGDTTAIFCNLRIYIGGGQEEEPDLRIDYRLRAHTLHEVMRKLFPWATYAYAEPIKEYSAEVAVHVLEVELRPEAQAYLDSEEFFEAGYPEEEEPQPPETEDWLTAEEEAAFWRSRGQSRKPRDFDE